MALILACFLWFKMLFLWQYGFALWPEGLLTDLLLIFQEAVDYRRQGASCSQPGELRGRKIMKRIVDIRELNEQAKVIDDLKYV